MEKAKLYLEKAEEKALDNLVDKAGAGSLIFRMRTIRFWTVAVRYS